jgi:ABC-type bacteriocin/lantibiotic exporter with double-glycine peptidase domain
LEATFARGGSFPRRALRLLLADPRALVWLVGGALVEALLGLGGPWVSSFTIDTALPNQGRSLLALASVGVVFLALHTAWAGWLHERIGIVLVRHIETSCLGLALERFYRASFNSLQSRHFGETNQTMAAVSAMSIALIRATIGGVTQAVTGLAYLALMAVWFPMVALGVALAALSMGAVSSFYGRREARHAKIMLEVAGRQQQTLHVLLQAVAPLRVAGATDNSLAAWLRCLAQQAGTIFAQQTVRVAQGLVHEALPQFTSLAVTAWFVHRAMQGDVTLGQMMMAISLCASAMACFTSLVTTLGEFQAMRSHSERIDRLLADGEAREPRREVRSVAKTGDLVLSNVWFSYAEGSHPVLRDVSRTFSGGELSVLCAPSGSGKTTILRLLAGLIEPSSGSVRVLGFAPHLCEGLVAYLPQSSVLLQASIATNLRVLSGRPLKEALEIAPLTGLARMLEGLPMGVETILSAVGGNVSAGQKQLILLTAAFASGRPVVLLDEPTSQLDAESQAAIDWPALSRGRTVVRVEHRETLQE